MTTTTNNKSGNGVITLEETYKSRSLWVDAWIRLRRNKAAIMGAVIILLMILGAIFAGQITGHDYADTNLEYGNSAPQWLIDLMPVLVASDEVIKVAGSVEFTVKTGDEVEANTLLGTVQEEITEYVASVDGVVTIARGKNIDLVILDLPEGTAVPDSYSDDMILETIRVHRSAEIIVEDGSYVTAGTDLGSLVGQQAAEYVNNIKGTVFIDDGQISITQAEAESYEIEDGWELLVAEGQTVNIGDILAQEVNGSGSITAELPNVISEERCAPNPDTGLRPGLCVGTVYLVDNEVIIRTPSFGYVSINNTFPLGADAVGRDLYTRIIYGARVSLAVAFIGPFVSLMIGLIFGLTSGYLGGRVDSIMMRIVDIMYAFPTLLLIILMMAFFRTAFAGGQQAVKTTAPIDETQTIINVEANRETEFDTGYTIKIDSEEMRVVGIGVETVEVERAINGTTAAAHDSDLRISIDRPITFAYRLNQFDRMFGGMFFIIVGVGITSWMGMARLTRGQVLSVREKEYVEAAQSLGATTPTIMFRHVMPNILGPIVVAETLTIPSYISFEAFLSFIGLGVNQPTPSWGAMIRDGGQAFKAYPHQALFPAIALFLIMFAFNFLGDGLRDALDPRMRGID